MGVIGRYLDALPDDARDRVITAQAWCNDNFYVSGSRCLVGHAVDYGKDDWQNDILDLSSKVNAPSDSDTIAETFIAFDNACLRFGMDRVVRAIKQRAAKNHAPLMEPARQEQVTAGGGGR